MTVAITLKVNDGVVLAADSASTIIDQEGRVVNVYNNANKIFHLYKPDGQRNGGLPVGIISYGLGSIGNSSVSTLIKDLRVQFMTDGTAYSLGKGDHSVEDIAEKVDAFFLEKYLDVYGESEASPTLGFFVAGYSAGKSLAEEYRIVIENGSSTGPEKVRDDADCGISWGGETDAISRLVLGYSPYIASALLERGIEEEKISELLQHFQSKTAIPLVPQAMPIQDAIDLAKFLATMTINFSRFTPGAATVGGPVEVAVITKHEGFKWVDRKLYYPRELNQGNPHVRKEDTVSEGRVTL